MKKAVLLNSELSYIISKLGHKDQIGIGDAGLPIPPGVQRIDLAVSKGIPDFISVLKAILSEQEIEMVIMADEIKEISPDLHNEIISILQSIEMDNGKKIDQYYITHESFKTRLGNCKAIVRTGEFTPYGNIILVSGVVF